MIVSVLRVTEETPDEDTSVVSKRRVLSYYVGNKIAYLYSLITKQKSVYAHV